ncbi:MAG: hypothetical protein ACREBC_19335, partial [Pyrinomonadaceae bacterium]
GEERIEFDVSCAIGALCRDGYHTTDSLFVGRQNLRLLKEKCLMKMISYLFALTSIVSLNACGGPDVAEWTEEVQLHDGKVITLERRSTRGSARVLMDHRPLVANWELCYRPMNVYWKSNDPFQPSHFEISNGEAYVKVPMRGCESCAVMGNPENSTLYFVLREDQWQHIRADQFPDRRWQNLMMNRIWDARDKEGDIRGHFTVTTKWERDPHTEGSISGKRMMKDQLTRCERCGGAQTDLKLRVEAVSSNSFCK